MSTDHDHGSPDLQAQDRLWRRWVSIATATFLATSLVIGLVVLPLRDEGEFDPWGAICRAIGIRSDKAVSPTGKPGEPLTSSVTWSTQTRLALMDASAAKGADLVKDTCAACHGDTGISVDPEQFPNLAGQTEAAIYKQLRDFQTGARASDIMAPIAQGLTEDQIRDVAAYFAAQKPAAAHPGTAVAAGIIELAREGSPSRGIPSCDSCHGASRGGPDEAPVLIGQSASYLEGQLKNFGSADRRNDLFARMRTIAKQLSPEEIHGLALYYGVSGSPKP